MGTMVSQITSLMIVYSSVYSNSDQRKHPRHWPLWGEFTGDRMNSPHQGPVMRKMLSFDDVIMICLTRRQDKVVFGEFKARSLCHCPTNLVGCTLDSPWLSIYLSIHSMVFKGLGGHIYVQCSSNWSILTKRWPFIPNQKLLLMFWNGVLGGDVNYHIGLRLWTVQLGLKLSIWKVVFFVQISVVNHINPCTAQKGPLS